ncbi:hypothetical protein [Novosphingobium sp.]|uniref:hypothetical protein n=1 Tax=Novosphingobium sp. TaxID=1874826 RepID=UPI0027361597|nr:hypothetical protein [Novosphingobium sp.]MDP3907713.1 hypothetical protein [Novosphingobium sp.]
MRHLLLPIPLASLIAALWLTAPATAQPQRPGEPPRCMTASHERLLLRKGRDICAPTLSRSGRPTAAGFMPTGCALAQQTYEIDAVGLADRCHPPHKTEK